MISGATGFGDSPPSYTGKQEWPELVGENAALVKAQLIAETHLQVGQTVACLTVNLHVTLHCRAGTVPNLTPLSYEVYSHNSRFCHIPQVILVPQGSAVTSDYRTTRIRIFYDPATFTVVEPRPSVG